MTKFTEMIRNAVAKWDGIAEHDHRFGGTEFMLGKVEIGHLHSNGLVDIPFTRKLRNQLINESKASPHHILPESGWISYSVRNEADSEHAIWLFRLSYLHKLSTRNRHADHLNEEFSKLHLSDSLQTSLGNYLTKS
jgi:luciferase-like monooxygenase